MIEELTGKQMAFIHHYMTNGFNGTRAAQAAGYEGDDNVLAVSAYDNLRNPKIRAVIDKLFSEIHMTRDEVLARLAVMARGDLSPFLNPEGGLDLTTEQAQRNIPCLKKIKQHEYRGTNKAGDDFETVDTEIELHDPQSALVHLGRFHKLFSDVTQIRTWEDDIADLLRANKITIEQVEAELGETIASRIAARAGILRSQNSKVETGGTGGKDPIP